MYFSNKLYLSIYLVKIRLHRYNRLPLNVLRFRLVSYFHKNPLKDYLLAQIGSQNYLHLVWDVILDRFRTYFIREGVQGREMTSGASWYVELGFPAKKKSFSENFAFFAKFFFSLTFRFVFAYLSLTKNAKML